MSLEEKLRALTEKYRNVHEEIREVAAPPNTIEEVEHLKDLHLYAHLIVKQAEKEIPSC